MQHCAARLICGIAAGFCGIRLGDHRLGDDQLPGLRPRPVPGCFAQPRRPHDAGAQGGHAVLVRTRPWCGAWPRDRLASSTWPQAIADASTRWILPAKARSCGPRISPKCSPSPPITNGTLYAGTSPDGKVYRIEKGKATEYFTPKTRYIWSLAAGPDGALYVGTGDQGKIYRVTSAGNGELYYDTGQSHVTGLAVDAQGRLLAGTEPNGILYRVSAKDKAFVLYDASLPEIRAIIPQPDGTVYAAALGGSLAKRTQAATQASQANVSGTTVQAAPHFDHRGSAEHAVRRRNSKPRRTPPSRRRPRPRRR